MNTFKLVSRNLLRRKGRFLFTLLGISIGMASFIALLSLGGGMQTEINRQAAAMGTDLIITPRNWCAYDQISIFTGEALPESMQEDVYDKVAVIEGITAIPYLTQSSGLRNSPVMVIGVLPRETLDYKGWQISEGAYFNSQDERVAVVGSSIASQFDLALDDVLTIRGEKFPVKAILVETRSNDDVAIYLPLSVAQEIFDVGSYISYIAAKVDDLTQTESYIAAIMDVANVAVSTDTQLLNSVMAILGSVNVTLQMIAGVALVAAAFGIINTMMTAIHERRREIGIMRAIGGKSRDIFRIFLLESGLYGLLGGVVGVIAGIPVSLFAGPLISQSSFNALLKGATPEASFDAPMIITAILFSIVISVAAGVYPAWKAARLTPVEAICS